MFLIGPSLSPAITYGARCPIDWEDICINLGPPRLYCSGFEVPIWLEYNGLFGPFQTLYCSGFEVPIWCCIVCRLLNWGGKGKRGRGEEGKRGRGEKGERGRGGYKLLYMDIWIGAIINIWTLNLCWYHNNLWTFKFWIINVADYCFTTL